MTHPIVIGRQLDDLVGSLPDLVQLKNLKELSLYNTKLAVVPDSLMALSNLKTLDIWNTKIKPDDWILKQLKEAGVNINFGMN